VNQTVAVTLDPIVFNQRAGVVASITACNGVLYIIDAVLVLGKCRVSIHFCVVQVQFIPDLHSYWIIIFSFSK